MATDYRKQIEKDASAAKSLEPAERKKVRERLQAKVGKEPMTVKEVAAWIELTDRDGESFTVMEKTIKNYINSLCEMRKELKIEYFKNDRGEYIIKPEIQGLFFCLIDTDIVRKHKNNLSHRANINKQMIENVDRYLNPVDALMVKSSQEYANAELEEKLLDYLFRELYLVIQKLVTLDSRCRYEYMLDFVKWLDCFRKKLMGQKVKLGIVLEYAEECYPNVNRDIFENDTLEQFLISNMILKLEGKNEAKTMNAYYNMTPEGHLLANCLYGDSSFLEHIKKEVDIPFHNNKIYQEFEEKANQAFDQNIQEDRVLLEIIDAILHALYCVEKVDGDEYRMIFDMVERDQRTVLDSKEKNIVDMVDKAVNETRLQLQILEYKKFRESKEYIAFQEYKKIRNEDWFQKLITENMA